MIQKVTVRYFCASICTSLSLQGLIGSATKIQMVFPAVIQRFSAYTGGAIHDFGRFILLPGRADFQEILRVEFLNFVPLHLCCVVELRVSWFHIKMQYVQYYMRNLD